MERLCAQFRSVYCPSSIDEAMIPFKGRSTLKEYMPMKPNKRGIKVWAMSDAHNGYVSELEVYTGKKGNTVEKNQCCQNSSKTIHQYIPTHIH